MNFKFSNAYNLLYKNLNPIKDNKALKIPSISNENTSEKQINSSLNIMNSIYI